MAKRKNIRTAGRLMTGVVYTVPSRGGTEQERSAKTQVSTLGREKMNMKYSWQKMEWLVAANFDYQDLMLTLTYRDDCRPEKRADAVKRFRKWVKAVRDERKKTGEATLYIYCTEGLHGDHKLHHHVIINCRTDSVQQLIDLWPHGNVDYEPIGVMGYTKLAQYLTKEPREEGHWNVGERTWTPSMGLHRPKPETGWCPDTYTLAPPPGAHVLFSDTVRNEWGEFTYLKCILPESPQDLPKRYRRPPRRPSAET